MRIEKDAQYLSKKVVYNSMTAKSSNVARASLQPVNCVEKHCQTVKQITSVIASLMWIKRVRVNVSSKWEIENFSIEEVFAVFTLQVKQKGVIQKVPGKILN